MSARKKKNVGAKRYRMSRQSRLSEFDRLHGTAIYSVRLVQAISSMLFDATAEPNNDKKAAEAALIASAAFGRLKIETQHVLLCVSNLHHDERGGAQ